MGPSVNHRIANRSCVSDPLTNLFEHKDRSPLVSVVIPTHNRITKLLRLIDSILLSDYKNIEVIVVEDATSGDYSGEDKSNFSPSVRFIKNSKELLLAGSRNVGILNSKGELIFLIDDDNVVDRDTVSELVRVMRRDEQAGVTGPVMYYLADPARVWCGRVKRDYLTSRTEFPDRGRVSIFGNNPIESEEFPNAFMIRKAILSKVGLFDADNFSIHYDEADFCNRVRRTGFRVLLVPTAKVWHDTPLPTGRVGRTRRYSVHTAQRAFYAARNRVLFHRKYSTSKQFTFLATFFLPATTLLYLGAIIADSGLYRGERLRNAKAYLRGTVEGLKFRSVPQK